MLKKLLIGLLFVMSMASASGITHRALIFGLGKQQDTSWAKIHGDNDVYYVTRMLLSMGYTDIVTLKNEKATKQGMERAFMDLVKRCRRGDHVYIHYSGHGQLITDLDGDESKKWNNSHANWDESWIPYDAYMTYCTEDRGEKHFSDDEVAEYLKMIRQRIGSRGKLIVVVDACHSGDATSGEDDECVRGVDLKFNIPCNANAEAVDPVMEDWLTISACQPYQLCSEVKDKRVGKLTYALYKLGAKALEKSNKELEKMLSSYIELYRGRLTQTPMVTGRK